MTNHFFIYFLICILKFVHPYPKGNELNVPAPFRAGVNRDNQFAKQEQIIISILILNLVILKINF